MSSNAIRETKDPLPTKWAIRWGSRYLRRPLEHGDWAGDAIHWYPKGEAHRFTSRADAQDALDRVKRRQRYKGQMKTARIVVLVPSASARVLHAASAVVRREEIRIALIEFGCPEEKVQQMGVAEGRAEMRRLMEEVRRWRG